MTEGVDVYASCTALWAIICSTRRHFHSRYVNLIICLVHCILLSLIWHQLYLRPLLPSFIFPLNHLQIWSHWTVTALNRDNLKWSYGFHVFEAWKNIFNLFQVAFLFFALCFFIIFLNKKINCLIIALCAWFLNLLWENIS